jgi:hypothetical protein
MGWATFWENFSKTHLVTLFTRIVSTFLSHTFHTYPREYVDIPFHEFVDVTVRGTSTTVTRRVGEKIVQTMDNYIFVKNQLMRLNVLVVHRLKCRPTKCCFS